jgi:hypothetical protein
MIKSGTKSKSVLVNMLIKRIKNLQLIIEDANEVLAACRFLTQNYEKIRNSMHFGQYLQIVESRFIFHFDRYDKPIHIPESDSNRINTSLFKTMQLSDFGSIPKVDINSHKAITDTLNTLKERLIILTKLSPYNDPPSLYYYDDSDTRYGLNSDYEKIFNNPVYDESLIEKAWAAIIIEEVHKL